MPRPSFIQSNEGIETACAALFFCSLLVQNREHIGITIGNMGWPGDYLRVKSVLTASLPLRLAVVERGLRG